MAAPLPLDERAPAELFGLPFAEYENIQPIMTEFRENIISAFKQFNFDDTTDLLNGINFLIQKLKENYLAENFHLKLYIITSAAKMIDGFHQHPMAIIEKIPKDQRQHFSIIKNFLEKISERLSREYRSCCNDSPESLRISLIGGKDNISVITDQTLTTLHEHFTQRI